MFKLKILTAWLLLLPHIYCSSTPIIHFIDDFEATNLSTNGKIVTGYSTSSDFIQAAFWSNGNTTELGIEGVRSIAYDVSNDGVVVGEVTPYINSSSQAFTWFNGNTEVFVHNESSTSYSAISSNGTTKVGSYYFKSGGLAPDGFKALINNDSSIKTFGSHMPPYGSTVYHFWTVPNDVNYDGSVIVGKASQYYAFEKAFIYKNGVYSDLGLTNTIRSWANGTSEMGNRIVGSFVDKDNKVIEPFFWSQDDGITKLGIRGQGQTISGNGEFIGGGQALSDHNNNLFSSAFLWNENSGIIDLNKYIEKFDLTDMVLSDITSLSKDAMTIVGTAQDKFNKQSTFVLYLDTPLINEVSEPSTFILFFASLIILLNRHKIKK